MRLAAFILVALSASGCSRETGPIAPPSPIPPAGVKPSTGTILWGMIVDQTGACIAGATIRVVSGQREGESMVQSTPCDVWSDGGFEFQQLTPGAPMTLRASAAGYADLEQTLTPSVGPQMANAFVLSPAGHD